MEVDALNDWYRKFEEKYPVVGKVRDSDFKAPKKRKKTLKASSTWALLRCGSILENVFYSLLPLLVLHLNEEDRSVSCDHL